ncbi:MAG: hypothetical protein HY259_04570 [Chloroflexi bacterium]|nr:hypothetical protein [Chloroflexota bacterium]
MIPFLKFVSGIALLLYGACLLTFVFAVRAWWTALREQRRSIFQMEKEAAGERALRALTIALGVVALAVLIYYADANASVAVPVAPERSPTPNIALLFNTATPTGLPPPATPAPPSPTPLRGLPSPSGTRPAATNTPLPLLQPSPTPLPPPPTCPEPSARLTSPGVDAQLSGLAPIIGTAAIPNFQFYKVEFGANARSGPWRVIGDVHKQPVTDGLLETFDTAGLPPGVYFLQLTVVDRTGNFPFAPCQVRVSIGP